MDVSLLLRMFLEGSSGGYKGTHVSPMLNSIQWSRTPVVITDHVISITSMGRAAEQYSTLDSRVAMCLRAYLCIVIFSGPEWFVAIIEPSASNRLLYEVKVKVD